MRNLRLILDADLYGDMFYFVHPDTMVQVSPCFNSESDAIKWFETSIYRTEYTGAERRKVRRSQRKQNQRATDVSFDAR